MAKEHPILYHTAPPGSANQEKVCAPWDSFLSVEEGDPMQTLKKATNALQEIMLSGQTLPRTVYGAIVHGVCAGIFARQLPPGVGAHVRSVATMLDAVVSTVCACEPGSSKRWSAIQLVWPFPETDPRTLHMRLVMVVDFVSILTEPLMKTLDCKWVWHAWTDLAPILSSLTVDSEWRKAWVKHWVDERDALVRDLLANA